MDSRVEHGLDLERSPDVTNARKAAEKRTKETPLRSTAKVSPLENRDKVAIVEEDTRNDKGQQRTEIRLKPRKRPSLLMVAEKEQQPGGKHQLKRP